MNTSFDSTEWLAKPIAARPESDEMLDWHALRSRLLAGRAISRALKSAFDESPHQPFGSFDSDSARVLSQLGNGSHHINQTRIGVGKLVSDNPTSVVGTPTTGDRG